jgi:hypothetical protein
LVAQWFVGTAHGSGSIQRRSQQSRPFANQRALAEHVPIPALRALLVLPARMHYDLVEGAVVNRPGFRGGSMI